MPGGNTSSRKRPYRMTKRSAMQGSDYAIQAGELYDMADEAYKPDMEFGFNTELGGVAKNGSDSGQGNDGWTENWPGKGVVRSRDPGKAKGDATPGGGWD